MQQKCYFMAITNPKVDINTKKEKRIFSNRRKKLYNRRTHNLLFLSIRLPKYTPTSEEYKRWEEFA